MGQIGGFVFVREVMMGSHVAGSEGSLLVHPRHHGLHKPLLAQYNGAIQPRRRLTF